MKRRPRVPRDLFNDYPGQLAFLTRKLPNGCWEYVGFINSGGYGQVGRNIGAHRLAWEVAHGTAVPDGLVIDHQCHNSDPDCRDDNACRHRRCVNPAHLEAVPTRVNNLRGNGWASTNAGKTHCAQGHEFTPENTYWRPDRYGRVCIICRDEALRRGREKWRERKAAAERRRRARIKLERSA